MNYKMMRQIIESLANTNYKEFIKAIISFEKSIDEEPILDQLFQKYIESDELGILNDEFDYMIEDIRGQNNFIKLKDKNGHER